MRADVALKEADVPLTVPVVGAGVMDDHNVTLVGEVAGLSARCFAGWALHSETAIVIKASFFVRKQRSAWYCFTDAIGHSILYMTANLRVVTLGS